MRIIVDLPEYLILQARELIREGRYSDISSFLVTSVENQLMLDKTDIEAGTVLVQGSESRRTPWRASIPLDMGYARADYSQAETVSVHGWADRGEGDWLWGQVNKMLPIKFAVRLLANEVTKTGRVPLLEQFDDKAAAMARVFGLSLKAVDEREERRPGAKLSTGFPISDKIDRAQQRFRSQFIGQLAGNGKKSGALPELNLGNIIERNKHAVIGLTRWGLEFAALPNPVLDEGDYRLSLSDREIDFYLDHIRRRVPWEASAFALILSIVADGVGDREQVNRAIRDRLGVNWTRAETNTQRAGTMSRMFDLRLLSRARRGRRVEYRATERGESWLRGAVEGRR
jgi:Arc/MetJ-type ribon-helix-helix transcriptional regulator